MGWFGGRSDNRRQHQRTKKAYKAAYTTDGETWRPAIGVDLSDEGMCILTQEEVPEKQFNVRATLDTRIVSMRCAPIWHNEVNHGGKPVQMYGLKFVGIAADDWDAVVRFTSGDQVEVENKAQQELAAAKQIKQDDVARLIPMAFQKRLFQELVKRGRLAPFDEKATPLVQFEYGGLAPWRGRNMHRLTIHSKINDGKKEERFSTRFMFDELGKDVIVLN
ncbi:MAG: PilZ domain-containing protein [Candidatus Eremiobacteraeota bacterium]|nr:PilZ domain-containing protein [Candidatus Eremiobacteraeota bacterium]